MLTSGAFTSGQITFIEHVVADTGLNAGVVAAWCLGEESGSAAEARQNAGNFNWLNIGYFDAGTGQIAYDSAFASPITAAEQTAKFLKGTWGGAAESIKAILNTVGQPAAAQITAIESSAWSTSHYYDGLGAIYSELDPSFIQTLTTSVAGGGVFGLLGTGTPPNQISNSLWFVGDSSNPDQDYWTTINQYAQDASWYAFSDGETLVVADGFKLMAQTPQAIIVRMDPSVIGGLDGTYDNSSWQYTTTHIAKGAVIRRAALAKVVSPTQITVRLICDIDLFRGGDTVYLKLFGPADGIWLVGTCRRSAFQPYSELTLVQAMQPLNANSGLALGPQYLTGKQASTPTSGTVIAALISTAATINNDDYPYVYGGGHGQAGTPSIGIPGGNGYDGHTIGYDCSGAVAAVLAGGGLWPVGSSVPADSGVIAQLQSQNLILPGQGSGTPECTLFDNPGDHIFMRLNGKYFGTSDGDAGNHSQPNGGAGWLYDAHSDVQTFNAYHVPVSILGQVGSQTLAGATS